MTPSQRLRLEASQKRQRLNELLNLAELDAEQRSEMDTLTTRMQEIEVETRAAIVVESAEVETRKLNEPDAEMRERVQLRTQAQLSNYLIAAARGHQPSGPEAELQQAAKATGIPLELWDVPRREVRQGGQGIETRAVTGAPGTDGRREPRRDIPAGVRLQHRPAPRYRNASGRQWHRRDRRHRLLRWRRGPRHSGGLREGHPHGQPDHHDAPREEGEGGQGGRQHSRPTVIARVGKGEMRTDAGLREQVLDVLVSLRHLIPTARKGHYMMVVPHN